MKPCFSNGICVGLGLAAGALAIVRLVQHIRSEMWYRKLTRIIADAEAHLPSDFANQTIKPTNPTAAAPAQKA